MTFESRRKRLTKPGTDLREEYAQQRDQRVQRPEALATWCSEEEQKCHRDGSGASEGPRVRALDLMLEIRLGSW